MRFVRHLLQRHPAVAALVVAMALALRLLVPGGFMPVVDHGRVVLKICTGMAGGPANVAMTMPGMKHQTDPSRLATGKCAYADLAQAMTGGPDPVLLLAALAFVLALALSRAITLPPRGVPHLRPPSRGPPATA